MDLNRLINSGFQNLSLIEEKYTHYLQNPESIEVEWRTLFDKLETYEVESIAGEKKLSDDLISASHPNLIPEENQGKSILYFPKVQIGADGKELQIANLIQQYRRYGHLLAKINPLSISDNLEPEQLKLENLGFFKKDLATSFPTMGILQTSLAPLLDIINGLKVIYCDRIGVEYPEEFNPEAKNWLQEQIESKNFRDTSTMKEKRMILNLLNQSELFESFLHTKYVGQKRFSLEGSETLIPMLASAIDTGALIGIEEYIFGMSHRGRLNVLSNIFNKSYQDIFSEFEESYVPASVEGSGDVKYHKGFYAEINTIHERPIKLTLTPNPSHLESVAPVVEGQVRAKQTLREDENKEKIVPILIHGDAAIAGQGIVYETLQFNKLEGYSNGGTLHFIVNNQIGFTTLPEEGRSTRYCTDIAKIFGAPVFHVNAEDPEGCVYMTNLAIKLRQKFHCHVFIELNCYRKYGHNEIDEPAFTQPVQYHQIRKKRPIREIYRDFLIGQGVVEKNIADSLEEEFKKSLHEALNHKKIISKESSTELFKGSKNSTAIAHIQTGVSKQVLQEIGSRLATIPEDFNINPKIAVLNKERLSMVQDGRRPLDWGMAELLAYGSLLYNGTHIRFSGQDSCRGTFSHRHAVLMDQSTDRKYIPLQHLNENQGRFEIYNSPLSEFGVLGFEFGYSIASPEALVIWEAQFGDFSNGAQVIIDQYIATAEQKWMQKFSLTLFLPHGYEGQGPEHSSARIERFLTLAGENNMQITNPTTPAQLFHLLRRQVLRSQHQPLIVFTPKGLLRHPGCISRIDDLTQGSFQEILDDPTLPKRSKKLVLCSGRIYYDLNAEREKIAADEIRIVRIEQLYPLDVERLKEIIHMCKGLKECIWVQEEPSNMGAWSFIRPILRDILPKEIDLNYIGRTRSASPAVGSYAAHKKELTAIINALFNPKAQSIFDIASNLKA